MGDRSTEEIYVMDVMEDDKNKTQANRNRTSRIGNADDVPAYNVEDAVYRDFSKIDPQTIRTLMKLPECKRKGPRGGVVIPFPIRLFDMLQTVEKKGDDNIVGWSNHGRSIEIRNVVDFVDKIMPKYFNQSKFSSFQRQLNLYGFQRMNAGPDQGSYYHEMFLRSRPDLCHLMLRQRIKHNNGNKAAEESTTTTTTTTAAVTPPINPKHLPKRTFSSLPPCHDSQKVRNNSNNKQPKETSDTIDTLSWETNPRVVSNDFVSSSIYAPRQQQAPLHPVQAVLHPSTHALVAEASSGRQGWYPTTNAVGNFIPELDQSSCSLEHTLKHLEPTPIQDHGDVTSFPSGHFNYHQNRFVSSEGQTYHPPLTHPSLPQNYYYMTPQNVTAASMQYPVVGMDDNHYLQQQQQQQQPNHVSSNEAAINPTATRIPYPGTPMPPFPFPSNTTHFFYR